MAEIQGPSRPDLPELERLRERLEPLDQTLVTVVAIGESERQELLGDLPGPPRVSSERTSAAGILPGCGGPA